VTQTSPVIIGKKKGMSRKKYQLDKIVGGLTNLCTHLLAELAVFKKLDNSNLSAQQIKNHNLVKS